MTAGRKPRYKDKAEIEEKINTYFNSCKGEILMNKQTGEPILTKYGQPVIVNAKPPTVTGLALALGFTSRQSLLNYQAKKEFMDTITRAKMVVEEYTEGRLFDKDGSNGAKFSLMNNFKGWNDRIITELDQEEQRARTESLKKQSEDNSTDERETQDKMDAIDGILAQMQPLGDDDI